ncbi:ATP-binding protein [Variovorax sp. YR216]|uniref:ATP-binding protein n=1 Tax=Variovorax sp. YR216 TaxID=1882828 RepID=UPI00089BA9EE|nr:ATP-binding protein [Variovorax sp. YR216]SEB00173.1 two-component system, OmpR family, sensor histidine kinase BaeS [Variovorax sp. YR216]
MKAAQISLVVFVAILLYAFWRILPRRSDELSPAASAQRGRMASRPEHAADIRQLLGQMSDSLRVRLHSAGMALEMMLPTDPLPVLLDRSGMQEVFAHIVDLACRAMHTGSTLRVLGRVEGTHAVVNFMDAAPGAGEPRLARCFDAAGAATAARRGDGDTAASVALCTQIVSEHRGRIYAAPSPLGSLGITLRLPLQDAIGSVH